METYRLNSKLVENRKEYTIQTSNDVTRSAVSSVISINGEPIETVLSAHPGEIGSDEVLSLVKLKHSRMKKEIEALLEAFRRVKAGNDPRMMLDLGMVFYYKRFYDEVRELLTAAVKLDPGLHQAFSYLALTELALGRPDEAVRVAAVAVEKCPEYADYRNNLGECLLANNSCKRAAMEFEQAIRINLYYSDAYFNLGLTLIVNALNQETTSLFENVLSKSADYFNKAAMIYPDYDTERFRDGLQALRDSDLRKAHSLFQAVHDEKRERRRRELSTFHMKFTLYPEWMSGEAIIDRIDFLRTEIAKNPTYVDLLIELGHCHLEQARLSWHKGVEQYRRTLEINPSLANIRDHLGQAEKAYENICHVLDKIVEKG